MRKGASLNVQMRALCCVIAFCRVTAQANDFHDPNADLDALPLVPPGFDISFFAREPLVRQPSSMAFDAKGRLYVGMGPQYRDPKPETPGDSVVLVLDANGDGQADHTHIFATGFNAIQGLAWHGRDLWVANAPDLTVVRDLDGDDLADEYVRVFTDLGNLEHGLHGLTWAPDGRLYMSKGNSKGLTQPGRLAPKPFRDLWGVTAPPGSPDFPEPKTFRRGEYQRSYHDPADDWGREGGILRCEDGGTNLEIVSRGFRNPWDIAFDDGFNWLGADNDQASGDRVFTPFFGAHFGWNHPWSSHWSTTPHLPTAPVSGPLFEGSATGIVYSDHASFPSAYRKVFFINDWLRKATFIWRPEWDGASMRPKGGDLEPFILGGRSLFRPTDLQFGPDGALWILGWSRGYGAEYDRNGQMSSEGRVYRVVAKDQTRSPWKTPKRARPLAEWSVPELMEDLDGTLPVWRIDAQDELVRRGHRVEEELKAALQNGRLSTTRQTWIAWTLGRLDPGNPRLDHFFSATLINESLSLNLRVQALRILAFRHVKGSDAPAFPTVLMSFLRDRQPRLRFEAFQALAQTRHRGAFAGLLSAIAEETDPTAFYAGWQALRRISEASILKPLLQDPRAGLRRAALLALLEDHVLEPLEVRQGLMDPDPEVQAIAELWLQKAVVGSEAAILRGRPLNPNSPPSSSLAPLPPLVRNLQVRSGAKYQYLPRGLRPGAKPYTDRAYELKRVPQELSEADFIQTANEDDASSGAEFMTLEVLWPVRVYIAVDTRLSALPEWLKRNFERDEKIIEADHWTFQLYTKNFPAGQIVLGGNTTDGMSGGKGNYIVVLQPQILTSTDDSTPLQPAVEALARADRERGAWIFHHPSGAACFHCHRLGDHGNTFGPDLGGLRERVSAQHVIQSILQPSSQITEGYKLQTVETEEGSYAGILLEESGLSLTLGLSNGERWVFPKLKILSRKSSPESAMPAYDRTLSPQAVADLTAYLLSPSSSAPRKVDLAVISRSREARTESTPADVERFTVVNKSDRLLIRHSGQDISEFVFRDATILRPYFANLRTPGGTVVTRNHPPVAGVDPTDHPAMHPGIWLGFGDINGTDFWRNKGRIDHVDFSERPSVQDDRLTFATVSRVRAENGDELCWLTNRFTLVDAQKKGWMLLWDATFFSDQNDITFGDQEEMGFGVRVATSISELSTGRILSSTGLTSAKSTWGQLADWCDYSGVVKGIPMGITIMAHPANFRPSWWHNRDYGVLVANPFGRAAMKQGEKSVVVVRRGEPFHLSFAAFVRAGSGFDPAESYREFLKVVRSSAISFPQNPNKN